MTAAARTDGRPPLARLHAALLVYFGQIRENPAGARVFLLEMASVSPATEAFVSASLDAFGTLLVDIFRDAPGFDENHSRLLLRGVIGGGLHIARAWIANGYQESVEDVADAALRLYGLMGK